MTDPMDFREPDRIFTDRSFPFNPEVGSIGIPNLEGLKKIIPEDELKPPETFMGTKSWYYHKYLPLHDFPQRYGKVTDISDFCMKAQLVSYEQYRALQEGFNYKMWEWYTGMLVWKNQNPWTALRGFFYDYFLDYTGGYFGYKHGAVPVHIQLNLNDSVVCAMNQTANEYDGITSIIQVFDMHGKLLSDKQKIIKLEAHKYTLLDRPDLPKMNKGVTFLRLMLLDKGEIIDENLYWISGKSHNYEQLKELDKVKVQVNINKTSSGLATLTIRNPGSETAFFMRLKVLDAANELVLPSFFSDNYITVFPGELKIIQLDYSRSGNNIGVRDLKLAVEGLNVLLQETDL